MANTSDALKQLQKAEAAQAKLEEKLVKSNEKLQEILAKDEEQLAKKTEAVDKVKEKVTAVKKDLTKAVKAEDADKQAEIQEKLTALEADLEKKKEAKKAYTDKVKKAKADNAKLVKDIEKGAKEIEKLKAQADGAATEAPKAAPKKETAPKAAPKKEAAPKAAPKKEKKAPATKEYKNRLRAKYENEVKAELQKMFDFKNPMEIPKLEKIVLNTGLGDVKDNSKSVQTAIRELSLISGQKPFLTTAKKSVANFKVREGMNIGAKVTLRGDRMYEFLDKFISIVLPRVRDFKGVSDKSFDGRGNYAMGVKEQLIFPEISYDEVEKVRGMDICIVTTARTDEHAKGLLKLLGMPFKAN